MKGIRDTADTQPGVTPTGKRHPVDTARGVITDTREEDAEPSPEIRLAKLTYEWRVSPKKGLQIRLNFENPHDTYERARGYVVVVAGYTESGGAVTGVYLTAFTLWNLLL